MAEPDRHELDAMLAIARGSQRSRAAVRWYRVVVVGVLALLAGLLWLVTR